MTFAFNPDDGRPARLIRYVDPGVLPASILSTYDKAQNLLVIDREQFAKLGAIDRHIVLRTHHPIISVTFGRDNLPRIAA